MIDTDTSDALSGDEKIVAEAKKRFKRCEGWESVARQRFREDIRFVNGDSDNLYQWPRSTLEARGFGTGDERPCMTVNKTRQHCLQIINDARQNKTSIKVKPVGNGATYEAAQVMEGIVRHIEYISDAQSAYATATRFQVQGGIGYWRLVTDYVSEDSFDQEIYIRRLKDPMAVYLDPDISEADGADARFGFVFDDMPVDEYKAQYGEDDMPATALGNDDGWISKDHIRVAEYFRRTEVKDQLVVMADPETGDKTTIKASEIKGFKDELRAAYEVQLADPDTKKRTILDHKVEWFLIAGDKIKDRKDWLGRYVPIVRVPGEETVIEGEMDRKGHVRALKDAQRMYNYNSSAQIEYGALQGKTPWVAAAAATEGQNGWADANLNNYAVLTWNHLGEDGNVVPEPRKSPPPTGAPLYQEGMQNAAQDMMLVSGQYQAMMGEPSNEKSGKAIQARQRQGENATYHFIDHLAMAIRFTGKIIIDLIPKVYDTPRTMKILGEDGSDSEVQLDPESDKAYEQRKRQTESAAEQVIMNPTIGMYDVMSDVGPDFATRRQEAFNALSQIAAQNPELMSVIGDLVMLAADFPLADEAAERLKRMVPPQALGEGVPPAVMQLQHENQTLQQLLQTLSEKLQEEQAKIKAKGEQKDIDVYKAMTDRMDVLIKAQPSAKDIAGWYHDLAMQEHKAQIGQIDQANAADIDSGAMAQQAGHDRDAMSTQQQQMEPAD